MTSVLVVDYGSGNLLSVARALAHVGADVTVSGNPDEIGKAKRIVLPGVGAFGSCVSRLHELQLFEPLRRFASGRRPFLGICVGMQMLFDESHEFGCYRGLGLIQGTVQKIPSGCGEERVRKVPHIGWNALIQPCDSVTWKGTILEGVQIGDAAYFLHSYAGMPQQHSATLAECDYLGVRLCSVVRNGLAYGCQFHPEKSGSVGLRILGNFVNKVV